MWFRQKQMLVGCNLASYRFVFVFCQTGPRAQVAHGLKFAIICQIKQRGRAYGEQGRTWDENIASAHWVHREKRARRRTEKKKVMAGGDWIKQVTGHPRVEEVERNSERSVAEVRIRLTVPTSMTLAVSLSILVPFWSLFHPSLLLSLHPLTFGLIFISSYEADFPFSIKSWTFFLTTQD